jgi:transmembrane sensor
MGTIVELPERKELAREAAEWLIRLDADTPPSQVELRALGEWLHRSPAHREELESIAALWGRMNILTELAVPLGHASRATAMRQPRLLLAAMTAVVIAIGIMLARSWAPDPMLETNGLYATAVGQQSIRNPADGSQVMLNTNSQIKVEYGPTSRNVYLLQGEALFTVAKNPQRPFRVYAGSGLIEAVGTAFSVYLQGTQVDVAVTEGRVRLATANVDSAPLQSLGVVSAGEVATIRSPVADSAAGGVAVLQELEPIPPQALAQRLGLSLYQVRHYLDAHRSGVGL